MVWSSRTASPLRLGRPRRAYGYSELVDVNDAGQAAGASGRFTKDGFTLFKPAIWRTGWSPCGRSGSRRPRARAGSSSANSHDINSRGDIVGNVYGLAGKAFGKLRRIHPVLWTCPFGGS